MSRADVIRPLVAAMWAAAAAAVAPCGASAGDHVRVVVDMDATTPGIQSNLDVLPGQPIVEDVAVYVYDPLGERTLWGIGYLGGIDRGIAFGHAPSSWNLGSVQALAATAGTPVHPDNTGVMVIEPGIDKGLEGPEVQYVEAGAAGPAVMPSQAPAPVFTVDVILDDAQPGDVFDFHLLDFVTVWSEHQGGAFSTLGPNSLDTGGDAVPDSTRSIYGVDPDSSLAVPPAAFLVDFIDGGDEPGPATITIWELTRLAPREPAPPTPARLHGSDPNPFSATTTIRYELPAPAAVRLGVYHVTGRLLRVLTRSSGLGAGEHVARWDGQDDRGRAVPPGVYVYRLEAGPHSDTGRVVLIR